MALNEKIKTEDVISLLDQRVLTTQAHPAVGVLVSEDYDSVLVAISQQILTPAEKLAFDNTLTDPSAANPVVLMNDLQTYIPAAGFGQIKDTVNTFSQLPMPLTTTGTVTSGSKIISALASMTNVEAGCIVVGSDIPLTSTTGTVSAGSNIITALASMAGTSYGRFVTGNFIPAGTYVTKIGTNSITINNAATGSATGESISFNTAAVVSLGTNSVVLNVAATGSGTETITFNVNAVGDMRAVLADRIIYRWNGSAWDPFIATGTLDHTLLNNQNGNPLYQHIALNDVVSGSQTIPGLNTLQTLSHTHSNYSTLQNIVSAGSGQIITNIERQRLPTQDEKDALQGTSGSPGAGNPYVTSNDTRLLTVRNPYVTVGLPGSLASFTGVDFRPFEAAITAISSGSASAVKAIEVLPGFYTIGGVTIKWDSEQSALTFEAFAPGTVTLSFQNYDSGLQFLDVNGQNTGNYNMGQVTFRGFVIELNDLGTSGVLTTRANTLIENCIFKPGTTTSVNQVGVTLSAPNCVIRRCSFLGQLSVGVEMTTTAVNCRVEDCTFDLASPSSQAILINSGTGAEVSRCSILNGVVQIGSGAQYTNIMNNYFSPTATLVDGGISSRLLENTPENINQPYVAKKKTIGPPGTYADYLGLDQAPFVAALADSLVTEIDVLPGTYTFSSSVTIPAGKLIRGVTQGSTAVSISGSLVLQSYSALENLYLISSSASPIVSTTDTQDVEIRRCSFPHPGGWAVSAAGTTDLFVDRCLFGGMKGCIISTGNNRTIRSKITDNIFNTTGQDLNIDADDSDIEHNHFGATDGTPSFAGNRLEIDGNLFLGNIPTKTLTTNSIWFGNYPDPLANNLDGVDYMTIPLGNSLEPISGTARLSSLAGVGTVAFSQESVPTNDGIAATMPVKIPARSSLGGYTVDLYWTSNSVGSVEWEVTTVFRAGIGNLLGSVATYSALPAANQVDDTYEVVDIQSYYRWNGTAWFQTNVIGSEVSLAAQSARSSVTTSQETLVSFPFSNMNYGLPNGTTPTHVSVTIKRVADSLNDTLNDTAHVTALQITMSRD